MGVAVPLVTLLLLLNEEPRGRFAESLPLGAGLAGFDMSLLENMRVSRSLTEVFSAVGGFNVESPFCVGVCPLGTEPASEARAGDFVPPSWDLRDEGFELGVDAGRLVSLNVVVGILVLSLVGNCLCS
jgi:hypothetical protein